MTSGNDCGPLLTPHDPEELGSNLCLLPSSKSPVISYQREQALGALRQTDRTTVCFCLDCFAAVLLSQFV